MAHSVHSLHAPVRAHHLTGAAAVAADAAALAPSTSSTAAGAALATAAAAASAVAASGARSSGAGAGLATTPVATPPLARRQLASSTPPVTLPPPEPSATGDPVVKTAEELYALVADSSAEISLHIDWQTELINLLQNLRDSLGPRTSGLLLATHSPDLIQDHLDKITDLTLTEEA